MKTHNFFQSHATHYNTISNGVNPRLYAFCPLGILRLPTEVISWHGVTATKAGKTRNIFHYGVHAIEVNKAGPM